MEEREGYQGVNHVRAPYVTIGALRLMRNAARDGRGGVWPKGSFTVQMTQLPPSC